MTFDKSEFIDAAEAWDLKLLYQELEPKVSL
jgi:hypothetical protein